MTLLSFGRPAQGVACCVARPDVHLAAYTAYNSLLALASGRHHKYLIVIRKVSLLSLLLEKAWLLQESKRNVLKDFVHIAGPLGVTQFLILTATENACYLRIAKAPRVSHFPVDKHSCLSGCETIAYS